MIYNSNDSNIYFSEAIYLRKFNIVTGVVTTLACSSTGGFADGVGTNAKFNTIVGMAFDPSNNLYISDRSRIRKYVPSTNTVSTLAGGEQGTSADGTGTNAVLNNAYGMVIDPTGTTLYFIDFTYGPNTSVFRKCVISTGVVTTIPVTGAFSHFGQCADIAWDTTTGTIVGANGSGKAPALGER